MACLPIFLSVFSWRAKVNFDKVQVISFSLWFLTWVLRLILGRGFDNLTSVHLARHTPTGTLVTIKITNLENCTEERLKALQVTIQKKKNKDTSNLMSIWGDTFVRTFLFHKLVLLLEKGRFLSFNKHKIIELERKEARSMKEQINSNFGVYSKFLQMKVIFETLVWN